MKLKKRKAFTLTELLVVVVIIGVLAAVALPKFNRVIETRRTGEAEEMLSAIRMEQEKRCTLDKPYAGTFEQVGDIVASAQVSENRAVTDNYIYNLNAAGVSAGSIKKSYSLSIPSYADGRICCEGDYCLTLNKNYPACNTLPSGAGDPCASNVPSKPKDCGPAPWETSRACNDCGVQTSSSSCNTSTGIWKLSWSACSVNSASECVKTCPESSKPAASRACPGVCGDTQTHTVSCDTATGNWQEGSWTACVTKTCEGPNSQACPAGKIGTQTRTCTCGVWGGWIGECLEEEPEKKYYFKCTGLTTSPRSNTYSSMSAARAACEKLGDTGAFWYEPSGGGSGRASSSRGATVVKPPDNPIVQLRWVIYGCSETPPQGGGIGQWDEFHCAWGIG